MQDPALDSARREATRIRRRRSMRRPREERLNAVVGEGGSGGGGARAFAHTRDFVGNNRALSIKRARPTVVNHNAFTSLVAIIYRRAQSGDPARARARAGL